MHSRFFNLVLATATFLLFLFTQPALAEGGPISHSKKLQQWKGGYVSLMAGAFISKIGKTTMLKQTSTSVPLDRYHDKQRTQGVTGGSIEVGYKSLLPHRFAVEAGLGLYGADKFTVHGDFYRFDSSHDRTYSYNVQTIAIMPTLRLLLSIARFSPYVVGAIGTAFNKASHYREKAVGGGTIPPGTEFAPNTKANFAYMLGAGCAYRVDSRIALMLSYKYADFGSTRFEGASNQTTGARKSVGEIHARLITLGFICHIG